MDKELYERAQKYSDVILSLEASGRLNAEEQAALAHLIKATNQMSLDMVALTQTLERQTFSMMAIVSGQIWAAIYDKGGILPLTSRVVDIASEIVQEIYKR